MMIEFDQIRFKLLTMLVIVCYTYICSYVGSLVFYIIPDLEIGIVLATITTIGTLLVINNRWEITKSSPSEFIDQVDVPHHPNFGTFGDY